MELARSGLSLFHSLAKLTLGVLAQRFDHQLLETAFHFLPYMRLEYIELHCVASNRITSHYIYIYSIYIYIQYTVII